MKTTQMMLTLTMIVSGSTLTAFAQENQKVAQARTNLEVAKKDSAADFQKFKKESELKISNNQKQITALKTKKSTESKEVKDKYDKKVLALEQKNNELKKRIETCNGQDKTAWEKFKIQFNKDMDELGKSIKSI
jgi:hypothetical protein